MPHQFAKAHAYEGGANVDGVRLGRWAFVTHKGTRRCFDTKTQKYTFISTKRPFFRHHKSETITYTLVSRCHEI
eukprot:5707451-Amphidinium_carterae.1